MGRVVDAVCPPRLGAGFRWLLSSSWISNLGDGIALASGANFVARAFSGDPNGTAEIIAQAMRHPGFSFVEILSR